jgi:hypothetical protein
MTRETYNIETRREDGSWDGDGIRESRGWTNKRRATYAVRRMPTLGADWCRDYRLVRESDRKVLLVVLASGEGAR